MADTADVTQSILSAWDELEGDGEPTTAAVPETPAAPEPEETEPETEEQEEAEEDETEETDEEEQGEDDGEEGDLEEQAAALGFDTDDPDVIAYLAQYQGDPVKALRAAAELRRAFGRQGNDLAQVRARAQEVEAELIRQRALNGGAPLSEEQQAWAESAAISATPGQYVEQAMRAGEYDLARAVCREWARENPFEANRVGQLVDQVEGQAYQAQNQPVEAATGDILEALWSTVPGMKEWEPQMVSVFNNLGPSHHLVQESRSTNPDVAMRALINIFEIAKASTASVQERKDEIKRKSRAESDGARARAAVSSATTSPKTTEIPRDRVLMPGLTLEALDTEFAQS